MKKNALFQYDYFYFIHNSLLLQTHKMLSFSKRMNHGMIIDKGYVRFALNFFMNHS